MSFLLQKPAAPTILHVLGNTGVGKTTVMDLVCQRNPGLAFGISVGRELRKRYPPSYFEGQATPQKTELEAMQIYREFVNFHSTPESSARLILVDGQPRKLKSLHTADPNNPGNVQQLTTWPVPRVLSLECEPVLER